jgi:nucleoside-diphosphate-sugar epimerase
MNAKFFIADIYRAIRDDACLKTSEDYMARDYLHPTDFHQLIERVLDAPPINTSVDCYTLAPIDKVELLAQMEIQFNLRYEFTKAEGLFKKEVGKPFYYSKNRSAEIFGYYPRLTSWQGICSEFIKLLA